MQLLKNISKKQLGEECASSRAAPKPPRHSRARLSLRRAGSGSLRKASVSAPSSPAPSSHHFPPNPSFQRPLSWGTHSDTPQCPCFGRGWGLSPPACPCSRTVVCFPPPAGCPEGAPGAEQHLLARRPGIRQLDPAWPRHRGRDGELAPPVSPPVAGCPGMLQMPGDALVWGPQGCCCLGSLGMLRMPGDAQGCSGLGSLGMLHFGVPRDALVRGPKGCSGSGQGTEETPLHPPGAGALGRMRPLKQQSWVWCKGVKPARRGCAGAYFGLPGAGTLPGAAPATAAMLRTPLSPHPMAWPRGDGGAVWPPQPLRGAERRVPGGCSASAFPFHPLPVPFQPKTWVSLLFWVGFLAAFFYYFNLGAVIIFSII